VSEASRAIFERYLEALQASDTATLRSLAHPEFEDFWPQSGELVRGIENLIAIREGYPGGVQPLGRDRLVGGEERFVRTPIFTVLRVEGRGDLFTAVQRARYPDGSVWFIVVLGELRDGHVYRMESYFAPTLEPPAWRSQWVEIRPRPPEPPRG
jgi:hypothetical protein